MTQKNCMTHQTRRQTTRTTLIFSLLTLLVVSVGCKKDKPVPTPADAQSLVGTTWKEVSDIKFGNALFKITFLTDTTFDCSRFVDQAPPPSISIRHYADGITRIDTLSLIKIKYIFDYKDGKGNIIRRSSNYNSNWVMLTQNPYTEGYRRKITGGDTKVATFTINNNVLNLTYINASDGDPVTIVKQ